MFLNLSMLIQGVHSLRSLKLAFKMFHHMTLRRQDSAASFSSAEQLLHCSPLQSLDENLYKKSWFLHWQEN